MCVSLHASVHSSITSLVTCGVLYFYIFNQRKHIHKVFKSIALFLFFVSLMQWYDVIFWLNQKENFVNYAFTKIAMLTNHLQPIVLAILVSSHSELSNLTKGVVLVYIVYAVIYSALVFNKIQYTLVTTKSYPVLHWPWTMHDGALPLYILFIIVMCMVSSKLPPPINSIIIFLTLGSIAFSYYKTKRETFGKYWCMLAAYVPLLLILLATMYKF